MREYTIILDPDEEEGGYTVTVPVLPGVVTQGETVEECIARAKELITAYIEDLVACGEPVPVEKRRPQAITIQAGETAA